MKNLSKEEARIVLNWKQRERYKNDPLYRAHRLAWLQAWREANPERVKASRAKRKGKQDEYFREWYAKNKTWWNAVRKERLKAKQGKASAPQTEV